MTQLNAVDVTKIHEDQLLERLGKADWVILLPKDLPNLIITTQWRHAVQAYSGKHFVRWVMAGIDHVLTHDYDSPGDYSGSLLNIGTDSLTLLARHDLLSDWAKDEYVGYSKATFTSGMGLAWLTYEEDISDHIETHLLEYVATHCVNFWKIEEMWDVYEDERWDRSEIPSIISILSLALLRDALQLSTAEAWKLFENDILAEKEAQRKKAEQHHHMQEQVTQFWEQHFPNLIEIRIEMPQFREMQLEKQIAEVLADADPAIVRMMLEVQIPGDFSNKVRECIQGIARRANR